MRLSAALAALLLSAAPLPLQAAPAAGAPPSAAQSALHQAASRLAPQNALYELTLAQTHGGDVLASNGTMEYDVTDVCTAWATRQRLTLNLTNRDGQAIKMISDYATWESKDGKQIHFQMRQTTDGAVTEQVAGSAELNSVGGPGTIHYTLPHDTTMQLPTGTLFPMYQTAAILAAAAEGRKFLAVPLFDGTGADGAQDSFATIASWTDAKQQTSFPALADLPSGRIHISFFKRTQSAQTPDYEVGMRYWQNGIADDLSMDFGDFVMRGKLKTLSIPRPHC